MLAGVIERISVELKGEAREWCLPPFDIVNVIFLLWKQKLKLKPKLPIGLKFRLGHIAKSLELRVDR